VNDLGRASAAGVAGYADAVRSAYDAGAAAWVAGPERIYDALADALVAASPVPVAGCRALDVGAGAGASSRALTRAGARVVAVDVAAAMLAVDRVRRPPAVLADAQALPFGADRFDLAVAACSLTHVPDPVAGLREVARVVRPGGVVLADAFVPDWSHPAKAAVEKVVRAHGWIEPAWYARFKGELEPRLGRLADGRAMAVAAGFAPGAVRIDEVEVDVGLSSPEDLVGWRLGLANVAPFLAGLESGEQAAVIAEAVAAVRPVASPLRPRVAVLAATVE
jgi:ubiquinone/menaquinone biosynthesis C-methylase UbiE